MTNLGASVGWGLAIAGSLLAGALAAVLLRLPERVAATLTAFGGGILLAAIAFELVPDADAGAGTMLTAGGLIAGTLVYVGADAWLNREPGMRAMRRSGHAAAAGRPMKLPARHDETARGEAITAGIFVDGVPESIALGLPLARGELGGARPPPGPPGGGWAWRCWPASCSATSLRPTAPPSRSSRAVTGRASSCACSAGSAWLSRRRRWSAARSSRRRAPGSSARPRRSRLERSSRWARSGSSRYGSRGAAA